MLDLFPEYTYSEPLPDEKPAEFNHLLKFNTLINDISNYDLKNQNLLDELIIRIAELPSDYLKPAAQASLNLAMKNEDRNKVEEQEAWVNVANLYPDYNLAKAKIGEITDILLDSFDYQVFFCIDEIIELKGKDLSNEDYNKIIEVFTTLFLPLEIEIKNRYPLKLIQPNASSTALNDSTKSFSYAETSSKQKDKEVLSNLSSSNEIFSPLSTMISDYYAPKTLNSSQVTSKEEHKAKKPINLSISLNNLSHLKSSTEEEIQARRSSLCRKFKHSLILTEKKTLTWAEREKINDERLKNLETQR